VLARLQQLMSQVPENKLVDRVSRPAPFGLVGFNLQAAVAALPRLLPPSFGAALFVSLGGAFAWVTLSSLYTSVTSVTIDNGMVAIPPGPGVAPVETVVSTEKGLIDQLYAREGMPVVPGQPLFSTRHDPKVDFDLLDRSAARDLSSLDAEMRDIQDKIDSLVEQIALSRLEMGALPGATAQLKTLSQKL
jgi:multidrug resistance efflux pump